MQINLSVVRSAWIVTALLTVLTGPGVARAQIDDQIEGIWHVGLWVTDLEQMLAFLNEISDFEVVLKEDRDTGGTRTFLRDTKGQLIELLNAENVAPHPDFDLHPVGRTAGVAHIAIRVDDTIRLRDRLRMLDYRILRQIPSDGTDEYFDSSMGKARAIFVEGPDRISFELFEFKNLDQAGPSLDCR